MKKFFLTLLAIMFSLFLISCTVTGNSSTSEVISEASESIEESQESVAPCQHDLIYMEAIESTCSKEGRIECYYCWKCKAFFADEVAENPLTESQTKTEKAEHSAEKIDVIEPTCSEAGQIEHWECTVCGGKFTDESCQNKIKADDLEIPSMPHNLIFFEGYPIVGEQNGMESHWQCENCKGYFADENGENQITAESVILRSVFNIPDFIVEIPAGKEPVILQLSDTQIIDGAQARPEHSSGDRITYATEKIQQYCYDYLTEIITATKPDLIILTGALIYGAYDDNGSLLKSFIAFMEGFEIPWAPVLGNHESESKMGVDWQCKQLEDAEHCLFKQRNLMGNGNYSVGILQEGVITRMFFMLDTNGNHHASQESLSNGHTTQTVGLFPNQIEWYTSEMQQMSKLSPQTKYSVVCHIQLAVFGEALEKYGFDQSTKQQKIDIDKIESKAEGDFGYVGRQMKEPWDNSKKIFEDMKALGVDSIFVGHEHCNSASVVYEGVRLQYGQKSSEYDRFNAIDDYGKVVESFIYDPKGKPIVGGSVIILSQTGEITNAYIYYCK